MLKFQKEKSFLLILLFAFLFCNLACKQKRENFMLTLLEIDGKSLPISPNMDAGVTYKAEVFVLDETTPRFLPMTMGPLGYYRPGKRSDMWELKLGENILNISVFENKRREDYSVRLVRLPTEVPYLTKLNINNKTIEGKDNIKEDEAISINVPASVQAVKLKAEANVQDAIISYEPELTDGLLILNIDTDITEARVVVERFGFVREYKVVVKKV